MALPKPTTLAMKVAMKAKEAKRAKTATKKLKPATKMMKAKRVSVIAKGRLSKALVFRGSKQKTVGGLTGDMLMKNKRGKIVSKRASAKGKVNFACIEDWVRAHVEARRALKVTGFVAINGKSVQGKAVYVKAKSLLAARRNGSHPVVVQPAAADVSAAGAAGEGN